MSEKDYNKETRVHLYSSGKFVFAKLNSLDGKMHKCVYVKPISYEEWLNGSLSGHIVRYNNSLHFVRTEDIIC